MKRLPLVVTAVIILTLVVIGCSQPQPQTPTPKYDIPSMSSRDVIILVYEDTQRRLGITPTRPKSSIKISGDYDAAYLGNGTWLVQLPEPGEGSWQWIVHEKSESVEYLGLKH